MSVKVTMIFTFTVKLEERTYTFTSLPAVTEAEALQQVLADLIQVLDELRKA